jgi:ankyrin repeat protein
MQAAAQKSSPVSARTSGSGGAPASLPPPTLSSSPAAAQADSSDATPTPAGTSKLASAPTPASAATTLRRAAETGDVRQLQSLLDRQVDINGRDDRGRTALMLATLAAQTDAVGVLLEHGADPNVPDLQGRTPLQAALELKEAEIAAALRLKGAR